MPLSRRHSSTGEMGILLHTAGKNSNHAMKELKLRGRFTEKMRGEKSGGIKRTKQTAIRLIFPRTVFFA
jgi:hypothetical protein